MDTSISPTPSESLQDVLETNTFGMVQELVSTTRFSESAGFRLGQGIILCRKKKVSPNFSTGILGLLSSFAEKISGDKIVKYNNFISRNLLKVTWRKRNRERETWTSSDWKKQKMTFERKLYTFFPNCFSLEFSACIKVNLHLSQGRSHGLLMVLSDSQHDP